MRPHVDELALRHPAAAHVLVDEDVALLAEVTSAADAAEGGSYRRRRARRCTACGCSRIGYVCAGVLRHVDGGEELHAVAHRDAVLVLRVVLLDVGRSAANGASLSGASASAVAAQTDRANKQQELVKRRIDIM